jgi:hypothetical protein
MDRNYCYGGVFALAVLLLLLAGCGGGTGTGTGAGNTTVNSPVPSSGSSSPTQAVQSGTVAASTPGSGPIVVLTPTTQPDGTTKGETVKLADRTLTIVQVSKQAGVDASTTAVSITLIVTNTTTSAIQNRASFYQLIGAEGDAFVEQSGVTPGFYGPIAAKRSRQGTITFQVPAAAVQGLQLLYRPEVATETVLAALPK